MTIRVKYTDNLIAIVSQKHRISNFHIKITSNEEKSQRNKNEGKKERRRNNQDKTKISSRKTMFDCRIKLK